MLQLLVGELQLLLVVAVLLHFGLKVTQLLLSEQGKEGRERRGLQVQFTLNYMHSCTGGADMHLK